MTGAWQLTGQSLATNQNLFVRARGYYATGTFNGSGSVFESIRTVYVSCPTISPTSLSAGITGVPYSTTFTASGALGVVNFGQTGTLPSGINFSAGTLSGTPTQTGSFPITVTAMDTHSGCIGSRSYTLTVSTFTDDPLTAGLTVIRAVHVTELRSRIDALRLRFGLQAFAWTEPVLIGVVAKAGHILELRGALQAAYVAANRTAPSFTDPTFTLQETLIKGIHIAELRAAILALE